MKIFTFDPGEAASEFQARGYVHVPRGVSPSLLSYASEQQMRFEQEADPSSQRFRERDFVLPDAETTLEELFDAVATVCGLDRSRMTLAESQLKGYPAGTNAQPALHKDRFASEIAVGIPLRAAPESRFVVYPDQHLEPNPFVSAAMWHRSLDPSQTPQVLFDGVQPVELDVQPGDAVIFRGARAYHGRTHAAGATVLYFKLNALRLDPVAADPSTRRGRENSLLLVDRLRDEEWLTAVAELSPRLTEVRRHYTRDGWQEVLLASVHGERDFRLTELGFRMVRALRGAMRVEQLLREVDIADAQWGHAISELRRMVRFGAIHLVAPVAPSR
ncbi:hypothetical protein [Hyalangium versicolor]|uniref:hypothetical protein n=1 Tax=Hyalangium versicolor TaxID=2861190 RepID=UPI001CCF6277|nr:hypothetical protein [Hyalangium versicolor]